MEIFLPEHCFDLWPVVLKRFDTAGFVQAIGSIMIFKYGSADNASDALRSCIRPERHGIPIEIIASCSFLKY